MSMALMISAISAMNIIVAVVINTIYTITVSKGNDVNNTSGTIFPCLETCISDSTQHRGGPVKIEIIQIHGKEGQSQIIKLWNA